MQITLPDARTLAYAEYGATDGKPVFFFHGIPGSRIFRPPFDDLTARMGVRLITVDRPGYGLSTFQPGRTFLDFVSDVTALADQLGFEKFAVCGHSGGAPYVAACALKMPHRLTAASILSGMIPVEDAGALEGMTANNKMGLKFGRYIPWSIWKMLMQAFYGKAREHPELLFPSPQMGRGGRGEGISPDDAMLAIPGALEICRESVREAFRQGMEGHAWEGYLHVRPLGFRLEDVKMPVYLWHGEKDVDTPLGMARAVGKALPNCRATFCKDEGHLLLFRHWEEILAQLINR